MRKYRQCNRYYNDKYDGHCHVKVDIYFTGAGFFDIPDTNEIIALMDKISNERDETKLCSAKMQKRCNPFSGLHRQTSLWGYAKKRSLNFIFILRRERRDP